MRSVSVVVMALALGGVLLAQQPLFRSGTELIAIDAAIVDDRGEPVSDLGPADFEITVDGKPRRVVHAEFIASAGSQGASQVSLDDFSSNQSAIGARFVLLVVDQGFLSFGTGRAALSAATELLDRLSPADRVGVLAFPGNVKLDFTSDRRAVMNTLMKIPGSSLRVFGRHTISLAEAFSIEQRDGRFLEQTVARNCSQETSSLGRQMCAQTVEAEAQDITTEIRARTAISLTMLRTMLDGLKRMDGPKALVWIAEGLPVFDRRLETSDIATEALAARTTIYAIHLDTVGNIDASRDWMSMTPTEDRILMAEGLDVVAGSSRGTVFRVGVGADAAFRRIARELSAYYLISIEPEPGDRDGRPHSVRVRTTRPRTTVRARGQFVVPRTETQPTPMNDVMRLVESPLQVADLFLRVATFPTFDEGRGGLRVLVGAEIGGGAAAPAHVLVGHQVVNSEGRVVARGVEPANVVPLDPDRSSPLSYLGAIAVPAGRYRLRFAVVDDRGRRGSVDHHFAVASAPLGLALSSLLIGRLHGSSIVVPVTPRIATAGTIAYAEVHGANKRQLGAARVTVDVLDGSGGAVITSQDGVMAESVDGDRLSAQGALPAGLLPPGAYVARLSVGMAGRTLAPRERRFVVADAGVAATRRTVFGDELARVVGSFDKAEVLALAAVAPVLARAVEVDGPAADAAVQAAVAVVTAGGAVSAAAEKLPRGSKSLTAAMLNGMARLEKGDLEVAAGSFRAASRLSSDYTPAIFYLASCYAAGGRHKEAAAAWQATLLGEGQSSHAFRLAADAWMRGGNRQAARSLLAEASSKWPEEEWPRLRLALTEAAEGKTAAGLESLAPAIDRASPAALSAAVQLTAGLALDGGAPRADLQARFSDLVRRYEAAGQPVPPLATRWVAVLSERSATTVPQ